MTISCCHFEQRKLDNLNQKSGFRQGVTAEKTKDKLRMIGYELIINEIAREVLGRSLMTSESLPPNST